MSSLHQSTSFVVDLDDGNENKKVGKVPERFIRGHFRNMSLPVGRVYNFKKKENGIASNVRCDDIPNGNIAEKEVGVVNEGNSNGIEEELSNHGSGNSSEGGTYTLEKDDAKVQSARSSIDKVFGIQDQKNNEHKETVKSVNKSMLVTEWVEQTNALGNCARYSNASFKLQRSLSKIPSPIFSRRCTNGTVSPVDGNYVLKSTLLQETASAKVPTNTKKSVGREEICLGTERYLKETESIMSAIQKRLDSGTDSSDMEHSECNRRRTPKSNNIGSNSRDHPKHDTDPVLSARYNRAFSLRRDRLNKSTSDSKTSVPAARQKKVSEISKSSPSVANTGLTNAFYQDTFKRLQSASSTPKSPILPQKKSVKDVKKKSAESKGNRSNPNLSPQEIGFQNWKRRKSYDPMKAAALGRKKNLEKRNNSSSLMTRSTSSVVCDQSSVVLRSASFHMTQGGATDTFEGYTSAEENELLHDNEEWKIPKPPSTSLENSPPGSRLSLLSNASSSSLLFSNIETVDVATINAISQHSVQLKQASCRLIERLSKLITEDRKRKILQNEIERAAACDNSLPLPPYQLSAAVDNLKNVQNIIQALEQVLLD